MFTCELCQQSKIPDRAGETLVVGTTYGPGDGAITLCNGCLQLFQRTVNLATCRNSEIDNDMRGYIMDFLLFAREHFEEFYKTGD